MTAGTLTSGTEAVPYMPMTIGAIACPAPVLPDDFDNCLVPGGVDMWSRGGFYSPGQCFVGYQAMCTQSAMARPEETVVRCIPSGYECNDEKNDQKYATSNFDGTVLSAPAFEIRWRTEDLLSESRNRPSPGMETLPPLLTTAATASITNSALAQTTTIASVQPQSGPDPRPPSHSPLSPGGIAGVAVGSGMSGIALAMAFLYLALRRRRRDMAAKLPGQSCDDDKGVRVQPPIELDNTPMEAKELSGDSAVLPGDGIRNGRRFEANIAHISLNEVPIEMAAEPVESVPKSEDRTVDNQTSQPSSQ